MDVKMLKVNIDNQYRNVKPKVNIANSWKDIGLGYVNVDGVWKLLFNLNWEIAPWGTCSVDCGGGVQYRNVKCLREDGLVLPDNLCINNVGTKPIISQVCNTQACVSNNCRYDTNNDARTFSTITTSYPSQFVARWDGANKCTATNGYCDYAGYRYTATVFKEYYYYFEGMLGGRFEVCRTPI